MSKIRDNTPSGGEELLQKLVEFCRELRREEDVTVTPSETIDAAKAVSFTGISNSESLYNSMRTTLVKRGEDYPKFDALFRNFWIENKRSTLRGVNPLGRMVRTTTRSSKKSSEDDETGRKKRNSPSGYLQQLPTTQLSPLQSIVSANSNTETKAREVSAVYSPLETTGKKNFGRQSLQKDRAVLKRGLRAFSRRMATQPGRRFEAPSNYGSVVDFRRTLRSSLKSGHVTELLQSNKKITKSRLVILVDISGSMDAYSNRLLRLIYYSCNSIPRTQVYGFSTQLVPLNRYVQGRPFKEASRLVSENVRTWSSGTRIGSALEQLIVNHSDSLRRSTVLVVVSDGWEVGDLDIFRRRLAEIKQRVARIVWLNPHADSPGYSPLASGMKAALPYIDFFSGLDVFSDRRKFERAFGKSIHAALPSSV